MELFLGTGGFSNEDWVGLFYPPELKKTEWLEFYSRHFNAVEVNSTFYAVPAQKTFASMLERSLGRLMFCVKLHRSFTHDLGKPEMADADAARRFLFTIDPVRQAGKLGPLLAQFPYSFKNSQPSRTHLAQLVEWFNVGRSDGVQLAVEFRHQSWDKEPVYQYLADLGVHAVSVDLPRLEGLPASTVRASNAKSGLIYARMHGRNAGNWFDGKDAAERHDYQYTSGELEPWVAAIQRAHPQSAYVFFQNTTRGQGLTNAREFRALWDDQNT